MTSRDIDRDGDTPVVTRFAGGIKVSEIHRPYGNISMELTRRQLLASSVAAPTLAALATAEESAGQNAGLQNIKAPILETADHYAIAQPLRQESKVTQ